MALTKKQEMLIGGLKYLEMPKDTIVGIMLLMRSDEKAGRLMEWLEENIGIARDESNVIRAAEEIFDEKRNKDDDFPSPALKPKKPSSE